MLRGVDLYLHSMSRPPMVSILKSAVPLLYLVPTYLSPSLAAQRKPDLLVALSVLHLLVFYNTTHI